MAGFSENGNELSGFIQAGNFLISSARKTVMYSYLLKQNVRRFVIF